jgi:hypothetical protein
MNRILRTFALAPQRSETFKLSKDPLFLKRCIVALYLNLPDKALVYVWMRNLKSKRLTAHNRCFR